VGVVIAEPLQRQHVEEASVELPRLDQSQCIERDDFEGVLPGLAA
jgi:hypothetical protein